MKSSLYPAQDLRRRTLAWAVKLRVSPRVVRVQDMRRKWGSCSSAGTVTLASDLVDQQTSFQDYVIVHELLHLRFPSHRHGRIFKALMTAHVPHWRAMEIKRQTCGSKTCREEGLRRANPLKKWIIGPIEPPTSELSDQLPSAIKQQT